MQLLLGTLVPAAVGYVAGRAIRRAVVVFFVVLAIVVAVPIGLVVFVKSNPVQSAYADDDDLGRLGQAIAFGWLTFWVLVGLVLGWTHRRVARWRAARPAQ